MQLLIFFYTHFSELLQLIIEHLYLVMISLSLAILIGIPFAIAMIFWPLFKRPILGFANVMQTIPSLALFGLFIPIFGIGPKTAILALFLYALLPIIRNTYEGIHGVDPAIREAGIGMGMTQTQLLFKVELPLAFPYIIAGMRIATVISIGTATIAAVIDAGGLGRYIFRGLRMNDNILLLAGAIPVALIALGADRFFNYFEKNRKKGKYIIIFGLLCLLAFLPFRSSKTKIAVGSKDFTEQLVLGELLAQVIELKTDYAVERHFDLGGNLAHQAIVEGQIDAYVEYTGTAMTTLFHLPPQNDLYKTLKEEYASRYQLIMGQPLGFNNSFALLIRSEDANRYHLSEISDLVPIAPQWVATFGQDFLSRPDGYSGLIKTYDLKFKQVREMDLSLIYRALEAKKADLIVGNATDGLIEVLHLVMLDDDKHYFPRYDAVPIVRSEVYPKIKDALAYIAGKITLEKMRHLNYLVDGEHRSIANVVKAFLKELESTQKQ